MITIKRITPDAGPVFKRIRLRALEESPLAFSSTFARESQFSDEEWSRRTSRWNGDDGDAMFLAFAEETACGLVGTYVEQENRQRAQVVSMWVDPGVPA